MPWKTNSQKEQRWNFVQQVLRRKVALIELCRRWGISRKTAYKWLVRFHERGRFGLGDSARAAHRVGNRPGKRWLARIRRWRRRHPCWGAPKIHWALKRRFGGKGLPSEAGIGRWLKRWGLTRKPVRRAHRGPVIDRPRLSMAKQRNDVWTVDFKGWFRTGDGTRVEPLTVRDLASRYVLAVVLLRRQDVRDTRGAFERIFARYGLPKVIRVDNGAPFGSNGALGLTRLSAWWLKLGIRVEFIDPGHPEQNGAHEQFHRIYKQETASPAARTVRAQKRRSERWRQEYNRERPHEALGMVVPARLYRKSSRPQPSWLRPWRYPVNWQSRLVKGKGMIHLHGQGRFVGEAFEGERVGLKRSRAGVWEIYFGPQLIGELWDYENTGIRAVWYRRGQRPRLRPTPPLRGSALARYARLRSTAKRRSPVSVSPMR
jgi:transposase InsO family protein